MKTRRSTQPQSSGLALPLPMIDVFALTLLYTLLQAQFSIDRITLPTVTPGPNPGPVVPRQGIQVALKDDGGVLYQGEPVPLADVPVRVKAEPSDSRPILVSVETDEQGHGHTKNLFQLRKALSDAGIENPVQALLKIEPEK